jgi:riboflavin biosynthesis pyrimidine reductase
VRVLLPEPGPLPAGGVEELYDPGPQPCLRAGFVVGVDGSVAVDGRSAGLRTASDARAFHALRAVCDAVVVGAGTARTERYGPVVLRPEGLAWRRANDRDCDVPLVVVSRTLSLDPAARLFTGPRPLVVTCAAAPAERRRAVTEVADVLVCGDDDVDLAAAVDVLRARGLVHLLCEGGPALLADLLARQLVDELCFTVSPMLAGGAQVLQQQLAEPVTLDLRSVVDGGDGALLCRWRVVRR